MINTLNSKCKMENTQDNKNITINHSIIRKKNRSLANDPALTCVGVNNSKGLNDTDYTNNNTEEEKGGK